MANRKLIITKELKTLIIEKSFAKITVSDLVERSGISRQAFYYHFQDIYETLECLCAYEILEVLELGSQEPIQEWVNRLIKYMKTNGVFYRRLIGEVKWEMLEKMIRPVISKKAKETFANHFDQEAIVRGDRNSSDFMIEFLCASFVNYLFIWISEQRDKDENELIRQMNYFLKCLTIESTEVV